MKKKILVVEDQDELRDIVCEVLSGAGYDVVEAGSGETALQKFSSEDSFDLVITDIFMAGIGGEAFAKRVLEKAPDTKFIYISGTAPHVDWIKNQQSFLEKPFSRSQLLKKIEQILGN